jgi:molybdopterin converting factor small subunit
MKVTLNYFAQLRVLAGSEQQQLDLPDGETLLAAVQAAAVRNGAAFESALFPKDGVLSPVIILVVNGEVSTPEQVLADGDQINLFSPVAGG